MVVANQTDSMYAGNHRKLQFTVYDEDGTTPKSLTGFTVRFTLSRVSPTGSVLYKAPVVEHTNADVAKVTVLDQGTDPGRVNVFLVAADTATLLGDFYWELELKDILDNTVVVSTGTLTINFNVVNA